MLLSSAKNMLLNLFMNNWARQGLNATQALRTAQGTFMSTGTAGKLGLEKAFNLGIREGDFRKKYRKFISLARTRGYLDRLGFKTVINLDKIRSAPMLIDTRYMVLGRVKYRDPLTGKIREVYRQFKTDNLVTREEVAERAKKHFQDAAADPEYKDADLADAEIIGVNPVSAIHHEGWAR